MAPLQPRWFWSDSSEGGTTNWASIVFGVIFGIAALVAMFSIFRWSQRRRAFELNTGAIPGRGGVHSQGGYELPYTGSTNPYANNPPPPVGAHRATGVDDPEAGVVNPPPPYVKDAEHDAEGIPLANAGASPGRTSPSPTYPPPAGPPPTIQAPSPAYMRDSTERDRSANTSATHSATHSTNELGVRDPSTDFRLSVGPRH